MYVPLFASRKVNLAVSQVAFADKVLLNKAPVRQKVSPAKTLIFRGCRS